MVQKTNPVAPKGIKILEGKKLRRERKKPGEFVHQQVAKVEWLGSLGE